MSGSPPLPPKASQEAAERAQGTAYQATTQDVYRAGLATQGEERPPTTVQVPPRLSPPGVPERMPYGFPRLEGSMTRPLPYPQQMATGGPQSAYPTQRPVPTPPLPTPQTYPPPTSQAGQDAMRQPSPKPQRKTKGHVASACVPCKRAHLRCDAQRPCSRCTSNGKEDACIDVQHKKRGRPRLRDDRETKFEGTGFAGAAGAMRRPMQPHYGSPGSSIGMPYDDTLRRTQGYRVLKSQPAEPTIAPRFPERALGPDPGIFPPPLSIPPRAPEPRAFEPAAFFTIDLEFGNASGPFLDAIGRPAVNNLRLVDVVVPADREKVAALQRQVRAERDRREPPNYLPPMFPGQEAMIGLGFSQDELLRYPLDWNEHLNFLGQDGQARQLSFRMGLAKVNSVYVVLIWLSPPRAFQYPTPSPNPREITYASYQQPHHSYSQPTPVSATFDSRQSRPGDSGYGPRQSGPSGAPPPPIAPGLSPALTPYAPTPNRPDYSLGPSYPSSRPDLMTGGRPSQAPGYQLPPIRNQQPGSSQQGNPYPPRDDRSRVDIGGLLDRPGPSNKPN
ncbi:hypothetical protein OQA88_12847 [Cercophora sp. LCS_1]